MSKSNYQPILGSITVGLGGGSSSPSGTSLVANYNGSNNGSIADVALCSGTPDATWGRFGADYYGGLVAVTFYDGTNWKVQAGTLSGTVITWGSAVTISGMNASNPTAHVCILSSTLLAVAYNDNEGTSQSEVKTYGISGTTLTLDQTLNVAQAPASTPNCYSMARVSSSRFIMLYANSSNYPTVIGINASTGSLTKDASATVLDSTTLGDDSMTLKFIGSGKLTAFYNLGNVLYRSTVTDTGTGTSATTLVQLAPSTTSGPYAACGTDGGIASGSGTSTGALYPFRASSGVIDDDFTNTSTSDKILQTASLFSTNMQGAVLSGAWLQNPDSDGYSYAVFPCCPGNQASKIYAAFIGINTVSGNVEDSLRQFVKLLTASATNRRQRNGRIIGVDNTTFILFYIDETNADYKYLVCKL